MRSQARLIIAQRRKARKVSIFGKSAKGFSIFEFITLSQSVVPKCSASRTLARKGIAFAFAQAQQAATATALVPPPGFGFRVWREAPLNCRIHPFFESQYSCNFDTSNTKSFKLNTYTI